MPLVRVVQSGHHDWQHDQFVPRGPRFDQRQFNLPNKIGAREVLAKQENSQVGASYLAFDLGPKRLPRQILQRVVVPHLGPITLERLLQPGNEILFALRVHPLHILSVLVPRLAPDDMTNFILAQLDTVALPHATFTAEALGLIVRSSEGYLRRARNLCLASLVESVRDHTRTVDLKQVNRVLLQPHWREREAA